MNLYFITEVVRYKDPDKLIPQNLPYISQHVYGDSFSHSGVIASFQQTLWTVIPVSSGIVRQKSLRMFSLSLPNSFTTEFKMFKLRKHFQRHKIESYFTQFQEFYSIWVIFNQYSLFKTFKTSRFIMFLKQRIKTID